MENKTIKSQTDNAFRKAVENTPEVCGGYRAGLQALKEGESQLIAVNNTRLLEGSVDIDACTLKNHPNEARWDYAIGYEFR